VENLSASIKAVNDLMREFDDISKLAASVTREKTPGVDLRDAAHPP
jgi:hypothetical protein